MKNFSKKNLSRVNGTNRAFRVTMGGKKKEKNGGHFKVEQERASCEGSVWGKKTEPLVLSTEERPVDLVAKGEGRGTEVLQESLRASVYWSEIRESPQSFLVYKGRKRPCPQGVSQTRFMSGHL